LTPSHVFDGYVMALGPPQSNAPAYARPGRAMRHTAATFLLVQGVDERVVMKILRRTSPTRTNRYSVIADLDSDLGVHFRLYLNGDLNALLNGRVRADLRVRGTARRT